MEWLTGRCGLMFGRFPATAGYGCCTFGTPAPEELSSCRYYGGRFGQKVENVFDDREDVLSLHDS